MRVRHCLLPLALGVMLNHPALAQEEGRTLPDLSAYDNASATFPTGGATSPAPMDAEGGPMLPSLPGLFEQALRHDADLSQQRYQLEATRQDIPKAQAGLLPQLEASASYNYQESENYYTDNPSYDPGNDRVNPDYEARYQGRTNDTVWQVQLTQPLFSVERWRQVDKAEAQVEAGELKLAVGERDLALKVAEAYLNAFLASRKLGLLDSKRESLKLQSRQAQRSYDLGVGDRINLLEAQSRLDQAVADQVKAENELSNALSDLERLTGRMPDFGTPALGDLKQASFESGWGDIDEWVARAKANLQVKLARAQRRAAQVDTGVRSAGHYPELNLNVSYSDRSSNDPFRESQDTSASLQLSMPIYQGGYTSADVRQGELTAKARQAAVTNELNLAQQEARKRLRGLAGDVRQLEALQESIKSSALFLEAAEKGENLGIRDLVDVLDARADLYDLRIQFVEGVRQYLLDDLNLQAAVGDLDTTDLVDAMSLLASITDKDVNDSEIER